MGLLNTIGNLASSVLRSTLSKGVSTAFSIYSASSTLRSIPGDVKQAKDSAIKFSEENPAFKQFVSEAFKESKINLEDMQGGGRLDPQ